MSTNSPIGGSLPVRVDYNQQPSQTLVGFAKFANQSKISVFSRKFFSSRSKDLSGIAQHGSPIRTRTSARRELLSQLEGYESQRTQLERQFEHFAGNPEKMKELMSSNPPLFRQLELIAKALDRRDLLGKSESSQIRLGAVDFNDMVSDIRKEKSGKNAFFKFLGVARSNAVLEPRTAAMRTRHVKQIANATIEIDKADKKLNSSQNESIGSTIAILEQVVDGVKTTIDNLRSCNSAGDYEHNMKRAKNILVDAYKELVKAESMISENADNSNEVLIGEFLRFDTSRLTGVHNHNEKEISDLLELTKLLTKISQLKDLKGVSEQNFDQILEKLSKDELLYNPAFGYLVNSAKEHLEELKKKIQPGHTE